MKCVISGSNIKILAKAIHALAKIGDELYVQPYEDSISFRTVSLSNSAYVDFTMYKNYFSYYTYGDCQDEESLRCKISMRCAMGVFKAPHVMDKVLETCNIKLEQNATKIYFILKYKNSIIKTHRLPIIDSETIQASYQKDGLPNLLSAQAKVFSDVTQNFPQNLIEITLDVSPQRVLIRNYVDESPNLTNITRTQIALGIGEFNEYKAGSSGNVTFCLKELRAVLAFAESVNLPISMNFETAGSPVVFVLKNPSFETNLLLSTLNPDVATQESIAPPASASLKKKTVPKKATTKTAKKPSSSKSSKRKHSTKSADSSSINTNGNKSLHEMDKVSIHSVSSSIQQVQLNENNKTTANIVENVPSNRSSKNSSKTQNVRFIEDNTSTAKTSNIVPSTVSQSPNSTTGTNRKIQSLFPSRKSNPGGSDQRNDDDVIPCSPPRQPSKRARLIFQKCFKTTFDPRMLPGHDKVLAEDSDDEK